MACVMRKPVFRICENKDADQLRTNCAADQRLCFRYIDGSTGCFIICVTIKNCNTKLAIYARVIGNTSN